MNYYFCYRDRWVRVIWCYKACGIDYCAVLEFEVAEHSKISQEELDALMPYFEVSPKKMSRIEKRVRNRMFAIVIIWVARIIFVSFYPEYHMFTQRQTQVLSAETVNNLLVVRVSLLVIGVTIYCASFYFNRYFRSANVVALIIVCCIIWSDMEVYILNTIGDLTLPSLGMIMIRFIPLTLLFLNYLDVRK